MFGPGLGSSALGAPTLSLSRVHADKSSEYCGQFFYEDSWRVEGAAILPSNLKGVIIQKITRTCDVKVYEMVTGPDMGRMSRARQLTLDQMKVMFAASDLHLDEMTYWELFRVEGGRAMHNDRFQSGWFAPTLNGQPVATTSGSYTITGSAHFYQTEASDAALGFPQAAVDMANGLPSTTTDPSLYLGLIPRSNEAIRMVQATWNCRQRDSDPPSIAKTHLEIQPPLPGAGGKGDDSDSKSGEV